MRCPRGIALSPRSMTPRTRAPTCMVTISPTPSISAAAVAAARPGFRRPSARRAGPHAGEPGRHPDHPEQRRHHVGLSSRIPTADSAPPPRASSTWFPRRQDQQGNAPLPSGGPDDDLRRPARRRGDSSGTGCNATSGATRIAADAGATAASTVNTIPPAAVTASPTVGSTGQPSASPVNRAPSHPTAQPTRMPRADPMRPISPASTSRSRRTRPEVAPTQRVSAICRRRWVIRMVKVFAMTIPAATTAITANPSSTMARMSTPLVRSAIASSARSSAVCTTALSPTAASRLLRRSSAGTSFPDSTAIGADESPPHAAVTCAITSAPTKAVGCVPLRTDDEVSAIPTMVSSCPGPLSSEPVDTENCWPTARFAVVAVDRSTITSSTPAGHRPSSRPNQRSRSSAGIACNAMVPRDSAAV